MKKGKLALLGILLLPFNVSATYTPTVNMIVHPTVKGKDTKVDITYTDAYRLSFSFTYRFYITKSGSLTLGYTKTVSYSFNQGGNPTLSWTYTFTTSDYSGYSAGTYIQFGFSYTRSGTTTDLTSIGTRICDPIEVNGGVDDGKMYTNRYAYSSTISYHWSRDYFYFTNCQENRTSGNRSFGLSDYQITMVTPYRNMPYQTTATLRILNHLDEFVNAGSLVGSLTNGYIEFPINVKLKESSLSDYSYTYMFKLQESYYVSLNNLTMTSLSHEGEEGWASTNSEIYIPVGYGHDSDTYQAMIILEGWGEYEDNFYFTRKATYDASHYGNCSSATYCVIGS